MEAATPLVPATRSDGALDVEKSVDDAFDAIMHAIADLIRGYITATRVSSVPIPTRHSLFLFLPFSARSPLETPAERGGDEEAKRAAWTGIGFYRPTHQVDRYIPRDVGELAADDFKQMLTALTRLDRGDPFALYTQRSRACYRAIYIEPDYITAAIEAQLASEFFLDSVLLVLAWEENTTPEEVAKWFGEPLTRRIRKRYPPRLGGSWEPKDGRSVVGKWARHTRNLRNRVAHSGHVPNELEVVRSWHTFGLLERYAKNRLLAERNSYPRTTLLLLGVPGLQRRGLFAGKVKRFVETVADKEHDWLESISAWALRFESAREQLFT